MSAYMRKAHQSYPETPDLFHGYCDEHPEFAQGRCGELEEITEDVAAHNAAHHSAVVGPALTRVLLALERIPDSDGVMLSKADVRALLTVVKFADDLAQHGARCDLHPTVDSRNPRAYTDYIKRIDDSIRERASKALE